MKRNVCIALLLCVLFSLSACANEKDSTAFYYRRARFAYGTAAEDSVISSEKRNITGHSDELSYLISLYLAGPLGESLVAPFPQDIRLLRAYQSNSLLYIELSDVGDEFGSAQYSLACACLSLTCMEFTTAQEVNVVSGDRSVTMSREDLMLFDDITENTYAPEDSMEVSK